MPGTLYHLIFAENVYRKGKMAFDKIDFLSGNLIPDLAINKQLSHYRKPASIEGFVVPDLENAKKELFIPNDPIKLGMYAHLYLDYYFIEGFLIPEFIWDHENMKVINPRNNKQWDVDFFFSEAGMHEAYTEINQILIGAEYISRETIESIPRTLPDTGLLRFDIRRSKSWRTSLEEHFAERKEYKGEIFDYEIIWEHIRNIIAQFIEELSIEQQNKRVS